MLSDNDLICQKIHTINSRLEKILQNCGDFVFLIDSNGELNFVNSLAIETFNNVNLINNVDDAINSITKIYHYEFRSNIRECLSTGNTVSFEIEEYDKVYSWKCIPEYTEEIISGCIIIGRDITDIIRKKDSKIHLEEEKFAALLQLTSNTKVGLWVMDSNLKIILINDYMKEAFEIDSYSDLLGESIYDFMDNRMQFYFKNKIKEAITQGKNGEYHPGSFKFNIITKKGELKSFKLEYKQIGDDKLRFLTGTIKDVTMANKLYLCTKSYESKTKLG